MALLPHLGATDTTYSQTPIQIPAILEENVGIIAVNMPLMRPLYGVLKPKVESRYTQLRHRLNKRRHRESTDTDIEMKASTQNLDLNHGPDWGLRVPGSQTMRTIDLSQTRTHDSDKSADNSIALSENKDKERVVEHWV
ncbi:MAG: hypothetical protein L6R35_001728 [Caloplaca aegaea]|nr:MAG: hypothetical protein L6R35_001728 [Caloplaca aegaea]